jgi:hypothetical protein
VGAGLIRAGGAFVEMVLKDEQVQKQLDVVQQRLKDWGASVDAIGAKSFSGVGVAASTALPAAAASVGFFAASWKLVDSAAGLTFTTIRTGLRIIMASVTRAIVVLGAAAVAMSRFPLLNKLFGGGLNKLLGSSQLAETAGRWTRFLGSLTGSKVLRDFGNRLERLGLASSVVNGFRKGGLVGGITSSIGAAFRSARSMFIGGAVNLLTAPFRAAGSVARTVFRGGGSGAGSGIAQALGGSSTAAGQLAANLTKASVAGRSFSGLRSVFSSIGSSLTAAATKAGLLASAIAGPALLAAHGLMANFEKLRDKGLISPEMAAQAEAAKAAVDHMKESVSILWAKIGALALPVLQKAADFTAQWADAIGNFIEKNGEMAGQIVQTSAKIAGLAAAFLAVSKAFGVAMMFAPLLLNPITLIVGAIAGIALLFPQVRAGIGQAFSWLASKFAWIGEIFGQTMKGIQDAVSGGNLMLAFKVLWAGINLVWVKGTQGIIGVYNSMVQTISDFLLRSFYSLRVAWVSITSFLLNVWTRVTTSMESVWQSFQNAMAQGFAVIIAKMTGQNVADVLKTLEEDQARQVGPDKAAKEAIEEREKATRRELYRLRLELNEQELENAKLGKDRDAAAARRLADAQKAFDDARAEAAAIAKDRQKFAGVKSGLKDTETMGSFSAAIVGRTGIGGIASLKKPMDDLNDKAQKLVDNTDAMKNGLAWV